MNILEYYINQQQYVEWYNKFQSTAKSKSGKIFSFTSTTYRNMSNFLNDLDKFKGNNGVSRLEWDTYTVNGKKQEVDKQRTFPLTNANIISKDIDKYYLTNIGYTCLDLIESNLNEVDKWLLLYIILLNYKYEGRDNDIILTSNEYIDYLLECGLEKEYILLSLKELQKKSSLEEIFKTDIFWYITFAKDSQFINKYKNSTDSEKSMLHSYVINEQKNKKSKDCIGHKYIASGQMLKSTFLEECEILYYTYIISNNKYKNLDEMFDKLLQIFKEVHSTVNVDQVKKFVKNHNSVYDYIFNHTKLRRKENE